MALYGFDVMDYGLQNDDPFSQAVQASLTKAQTNVGATGDTNWQNVIGSIIKYGAPVVKILSDIGVIKNKNLSTITSADYDKAQLAALLAVNGGSITDKAPSQILVPASSTRSSFDLSNPIVLIAIIALVFLLFFKK